MRRTPLRRGRGPQRRFALKRGRALRRSTPLARTSVAPASAVQRAKVGGLRCLVCGAMTRIAPTHLVPRSLGGCDEADCVVPLCRVHHRAYDQGGLDLVALLEPRWRREVVHAVGHLGLVGAQRRLSGRRSVGEDHEP
ncbi:MAG: HNH endonuclease signature motif containing protein [Solirubrobacteraceae bacterium]